jgi:hypothetical protein
MTYWKCHDDFAVNKIYARSLTYFSDPFSKYGDKNIAQNSEINYVHDL